MFDVRRIANMWTVNKGTHIRVPLYALATTFFFTQALGKETAKQLLGQLPVVTVDAVLHFGGFHLALNQPRILQFLEMLGNSGFGYREFLVYITEIASLLPGKKLQNGNACGVSHCLGEPRQLFLPDAIILIRHRIDIYLFAKLRTCLEIPKISPDFLGIAGVMRCLCIKKGWDDVFFLVRPTLFLVIS